MGEMTPVRKYTLQKAERLSSKKEIALLFKAGQNFFITPLQVMYLQNQNVSENFLQAAFTVSKRKMPLAVNRNRIKRLMREAYRLNNTTLKALLYEKKIPVSVIFIYTGNNLATFNEIENKFKLVLKRLHATFSSDK